jgi:hypothetical protein
LYFALKKEHNITNVIKKKKGNRTTPIPDRVWGSERGRGGSMR